MNEAYILRARVNGTEVCTCSSWYSLLQCDTVTSSWERVDHSLWVCFMLLLQQIFVEMVYVNGSMLSESDKDFFQHLCDKGPRALLNTLLKIPPYHTEYRVGDEFLLFPLFQRSN